MRPIKILCVSDGWSTYGGINNLQLQYNHLWVNQKVNFVNPPDHLVHIRGIKTTRRILKFALEK